MTIENFITKMSSMKTIKNSENIFNEIAFKIKSFKTNLKSRNRK